MPEPKADAGTQLIQKYEAAEDVPDPVEPVKPAEPDTVEIEPAKPAAQHPGWLAKAARRAGLDDADVTGMSSEELKEALVVLDRGRESQSREDGVRVAINAAGMPYDPATGRILPAAAAAPPEPEKPFSLKDSLGVDLSGLGEDPSTEDILTLVVKPLMDRITKLEGGLTEFDRREQHRQLNSAYDRLDQLFAEDVEKFGKGTRHRLKPGPELAKRKAVMGRMDELRNEVKGITLEEAFERATGELFGGAPAPKAAPKEHPDVAKFAEAATVRPANRNGVTKPKGDAAAKDFIRDWQRRVVVAGDAEDDDEATLG